jgi:hypothetical protein
VDADAGLGVTTCVGDDDDLRAGLFSACRGLEDFGGASTVSGGSISDLADGSGGAAD